MAASAEAPEQVLITGSLIRGTAAVGATVTNISPQDFAQTGSFTSTELLKTVPGITVAPAATPAAQGGGPAGGGGGQINIRGFDSTRPARELILVDGYRVAEELRDPSLVPALALDRIDIAVDGGSATYGSDAISGVINMILKRGYDGAVTQLHSTFIKGAEQYQAAQLWGRTWDGGDVTLTYEWSDFSPIKGNARSNFTIDFTPWGLDNRIPVASSIPATISTGRVTAAQGGLGSGLGTNCSNCFALPAGSGANFNASLNNGLGPTAPSSAPGVLTWATIGTAAHGGPTNPVAGTANEIDPYDISWYDTAQQRNSAVITVDQRLIDGISLFGEGFYTNHRFQFLNNANQSASTQDLSVQVPTLNPYYPIGAPANLTVNYNIGLEVSPLTSGNDVTDRYAGGLKFELPAGWEGQIYYSENYRNIQSTIPSVNAAAVSAALGWTIPAGLARGSSPAIASWTKPATLPYLNLFCDPRSFVCNSPATLSYITGQTVAGAKYLTNEKGATFDGSLFSLPAGNVKAAVGGTYTSQSLISVSSNNVNSASLLVAPQVEVQKLSFWAAFAQLNIPVVGEANALPLIQQLDIQASWRHDQYSGAIGGTSNPKVGFNWTLSRDAGVILRGDLGTSFRAPNFSESSALGGAIQGINIPNFPANRGITLNCNADPNTLAGKLTKPGSGFIGWNGTGSNNGTPGVNCGSGANPEGIGTFAPGGLALNDFFRTYVNTAQAVLRPETAMTYNFTAEFAPTAFLRGLDMQVSWYQIKVNNALTQFGNPSNSSVNDPSRGQFYIVPTDIAKAGVDVAGCSNNNTPATCPEFERMVAALLAEPNSPLNPNIQTSVLWVNDGAIGNWGWQKMQGIDFNASYDWDAGSLGAFNAGIVGTYFLHFYQANNPSPAVPNPPVVDTFHEDVSGVGGINEFGVGISQPRLQYRARAGWSDGPLSVTGFLNFRGHFFNTQNAPPNVNFQCTTSGGTVAGGTLPCAIGNYNGLQPNYITFDLTLGYDTGDAPANDYVKHLGIQLVIQNITNRLPPFEYVTAAGQSPTAFDFTLSDVGRTFGIILTKTW